MSKIISQCPKCFKKDVSQVNYSKLENYHFYTLSCGHTYSEKGISDSGLNTITLKDNRKLFPFQVEGVRFLESNNFRALITDEMGLGKTIQAVAGLSLHFDDLKPILIVTKASLTYQWLRETVKGSGKLAQILDRKIPPIPGIQIFITSFDSIPPRKKKNGKENEMTGGLVDIIKKIGIKTVIIDECQMLKNHIASRTEAIREIVREKRVRKDNKDPIKRAMAETMAKDLMKYHGISDRFELEFSELDMTKLGLTQCKADPSGVVKGKIIISRFHAENDSIDEVLETILHEIAHAITPGAGHKPIWKDICIALGGSAEAFEWCEGTIENYAFEPGVKHLVALSGTPIKNNAIEYFPILNLLQPHRFPNRARFIEYEVDHYWDGNTHRAGGLKDPEIFIEKTKDFIIRRTREEVMPDLPRIQRDYKYYPMSENVWGAYNKKVKAMSDFMDENENEPVHTIQGNLMGHLAILRHITGLAKLEPVVEYIEEFLEDTGNEKITIFHHHKDVGSILYQKMEELYPGISIQMTASDDSSERMNKIDDFKDNEKRRILIAPTLACGEGINLQFCSHAILLEREWNPANEEQAEGRFPRIGSVANSILVCYPTATGTIDEFFAELVERKREAINKSLNGEAEPWNQSSVMTELAKLVIKKWRAA